MTTTAILTATKTATTPTPRIRRNMTGRTQTDYVAKDLGDLLTPKYYNKLNQRPQYQRDTKWTIKEMIDLINTVMNGDHLDALKFYPLQKDDVGKDVYNYEVLDGHHRLYVLYAFRSSKKQLVPTVSKKPFIVHWEYETVNEAGVNQIHRVFYEDTPDVREWYSETYSSGEPFFLTEEEKEAFDSFNIKIEMFREKHTMDQRTAIFTNLQKTKSVRNADLLKNIISCKLMAACSENGYEKLMRDFIKYSSRKGSNYWTQWITRCFYLFKESKEASPAPADKFLKTDTSLKLAIKKNHPDLNKNLTDEVFDEFDTKFKEFIVFLEAQKEGTQFNITQMNALFYHFCREDVDVDVLTTHMSKFAKDGSQKEYKSLWENKSNIDQRRAYFDDCLSQLNGMTAPYIDIVIDKRQPTKKLKKAVFAKAVTACKCDICNAGITIETFESGHILARALGGRMEIDNLIPLCFDCNRSMGTLDPYVYKETVLPYTRID